MDPTPLSFYKMGRILRKDDHWVKCLEEMMTPDEKLELQELLRGTPHPYGGTMAPSSKKIYEFEERIYERKIQKDKAVMDDLIKQNEQNTRHIEKLTEKLTSNSEQLTNKVDQIIVLVEKLARIVYDLK
jgi:hypothetical protein